MEPEIDIEEEELDRTNTGKTLWRRPRLGIVRK